MEEKIFYFDPFGADCLIKDICDYLTSYNKTIIHSKCVIQHPFSFHCGYFCTGFILAIDENFTLEQYQSFFVDDNLLINDDIICDLLVTFLG